jgi:hypothetical protein
LHCGGELEPESRQPKHVDAQLDQENQECRHRDVGENTNADLKATGQQVYENIDHDILLVRHRDGAPEKREPNRQIACQLLAPDERETEDIAEEHLPKDDYNLHEEKKPDNPGERAE